MSDQDGPLSAEAEIIRMRDHYHDLNEKVGALTVATAVTSTKLDSLVASTREMKALLKLQHELLEPLVGKVTILQAIVYGAVGIALSAMGYKLIEVAIKAAQ